MPLRYRTRTAWRCASLRDRAEEVVQVPHGGVVRPAAQGSGAEGAEVVHDPGRAGVEGNWEGDLGLGEGGIGVAVEEIGEGSAAVGEAAVADTVRGVGAEAFSECADRLFPTAKVLEAGSPNDRCLPLRLEVVDEVGGFVVICSIEK